MNMDIIRKNLWNILLLIILLIIVLAVYSSIMNQGDYIEILTPDEVMDNTNDYLDKEIIVDGYYYPENRPVGQGVITKSIIPEGTSSTIFIKMLHVDYSDINVTGLLLDEVKYRFTGTLLKSESQFGDPVILKATKIESV